MLELIGYSAQVMIDRIEGRGTTSSTPQNPINLFTTITNWSPVSAQSGAISLFLRNPCQPQIELRLRKIDHARLQQSLQLYINQGDLSMTSYQPMGASSWFIRIKKLRQHLIDPTTVTCSCHGFNRGYGYGMCRLKSTAQSGGAAAAAAAAARGRAADRKTLQDLLILLPVNMRPLSSSADQDDIECLGEQNAVDMAFQRAEASGDIIVLD